MPERRRLLIRSLLATGIASVLVVWLAIGGSSAPAGASHPPALTSAASAAFDSGGVAWSAPRATHQGTATTATTRTVFGSPATARTVFGSPATTPTTSGSTTSTTDSTTSTTTAVKVPVQTLVATLPPAGAPGSRKPGGPTKLHIPGHWLNARSILPVIGQQPGWVHVRLAQRPNESTAWVRLRYVKLATDPYRIIIDLSSTHLHLYKGGKQVGSYPVGVGLPAYPTPRGHFFVALFAAAPSSAWGAFVIVTSAHSNTISDWEATGDAITAIHGPLGSDAQIGTTGARVSHGCVRMHKAQLLNLRLVPAGTPVDIHL